jgi:hypothetical protein
VFTLVHALTLAGRAAAAQSIQPDRGRIEVSCPGSRCHASDRGVMRIEGGVEDGREGPRGIPGDFGLLREEGPPHGKSACMIRSS